MVKEMNEINICHEFSKNQIAELEELREKCAAQAVVIEKLREVLENTHELYVQSSQQYGFAHPENPHNFWPDIENCSAEEIRNHSKACSDYAAGLDVVNRQWGIGTYCDVFEPALKALAIQTDSKQILAEWFDKQLGEPVKCGAHHTAVRKVLNHFKIPLDGVLEADVIYAVLGVPLLKKPEIK